MSIKESIQFHPVLDRPWEYELEELRYLKQSRLTHATLDLVLRRGTEQVTLRFLEPRQIQITPKFSDCEGPSDIYIADISDWGWENIAVKVGHAEQDSSISFLARSVERLP